MASTPRPHPHQPLIGSVARCSLTPSTEGPPTSQTQSLRLTQVLLEDRDLAEHIQGERLDAAIGECVARTLEVPAGPWIPPIEVEMRIGMGLLILDGMLVRQDGIHVPVQLTYATLAELIAARRPTVTKALGELADRSIVRWTGTDWLLTGQPPAELDGLGSIPIAERARTEPAEA